MQAQWTEVRYNFDDQSNLMTGHNVYRLKIEQHFLRQSRNYP